MIAKSICQNFNHVFERFGRMGPIERPHVQCTAVTAVRFLAEARSGAICLLSETLIDP